MRADRPGAKTWCLAMFAAGALCLLGAAAFGLGGTIEPLPDDPDLLQPIPRAGESAPDRLGALSQYTQIGARPMFAHDRRPHPFVINPESEEVSGQTFDYVLTSVLMTPRLQMAILQSAGDTTPVRLRLGQAPPDAADWTLIEVNPRSVVFNGPEGERILLLRVFNGTDSAPAPGREAQSPTLAQPPVPLSPPPQPIAAMSPAPTPANNDVPAAEPAVTVSPEEQTEAIRRRIEARRMQLRQESPPPLP